jgi:hypothetical protein
LLVTPDCKLVVSGSNPAISPVNSGLPVLRCGAIWNGPLGGWQGRIYIKRGFWSNKTIKEKITLFLNNFVMYNNRLWNYMLCYWALTTGCALKYFLFWFVVKLNTFKFWFTTSKC